MPVGHVQVGADQFVGGGQPVVDADKAGVTIVLHIAPGSTHRLEDDLGAEALAICLQVGGDFDAVVVGHGQFKGSAGDLGAGGRARDACVAEVLELEAPEVVFEQDIFVAAGDEAAAVAAATGDFGQQADFFAAQFAALPVAQHDIEIGEDGRGFALAW